MDFRILGPLTIVGGAGPVPLRTGREQRVCAALLLGTGRVVTVARLVEAVWDDDPPDTAEKAVRNCVSILRARLADRGARADIIATEQTGYLLTATTDELDVRRFDHEVAHARRLAGAGQRQRALERFDAALTLWRGPALAGIRGRMIEAAATGLNERRLSVLEERLSLELELGRHGTAVDELAALVAEHPGRERLRGLLMLALYRLGRRTDALAAYREGRRILVSELGIEPGPGLRRLEQAMLNDDPALTQPDARPAGTPTPAQLPADVAGFVGRAAHLSALDATLPDAAGGPDGRPAGPVVIATIAGTPGVGKTALAIHWAHRVRDRFPDGQLYVDLRGFSAGGPKPPVEALARFLTALGVAPDQIPVDVEPAVDLYRTMLADLRVLVVLDNAASADQVRPLLPGSPDCLALVTSRDRLGGLVARDGARLVSLDVLSAEEAAELLTSMLGERRTRAEAAATVALADACARLPLALRIAAANLVGQPDRRIADYVHELRHGNRLAALQVDDDDQAAVRAAFDQSYAALSPQTRVVFRRLGLVPGRDATVAAAAALANVTPEAAGRALDRLTAAHLVWRRASGRVRFHDLLRTYAAERAYAEDSEPDRVRALARLYGWYLARIADAAHRLFPQMLRLADGSATAPAQPARSAPAVPADAFTDHASALAWLDAERSNLVTAVVRGAKAGPRRPAILLADGLRGYFHLRRGHGADWLTVARAALVAAIDERDLRAQAAAELSLGDAHQRQSRYAEAFEHYTRALALNDGAGWRDGRGVVLGNLAFVHWQLGRLDEAFDRITEALAVTRATGRVVGTAVNLDNLGVVCRELGRLAEARDHHTASLAMHRQIGSRLGEAIALGSLAETHLALDEVKQAARCATEAQALHREVGDRGNETEVLRTLAAAHREDGQLNTAYEYARAALDLARETGDRRIEVGALNTLGTIEQRLHRPAEAIVHHRQALDLAREIHTGYEEAVALVELASANQFLGATAVAGEHASQAADLARAAGFRLLEGRALVTLAEARAAEGADPDAGKLARRALDAVGADPPRSIAVRALRLVERGV